MLIKPTNEAQRHSVNNQWGSRRTRCRMWTMGAFPPDIHSLVRPSWSRPLKVSPKDYKMIGPIRKEFQFMPNKEHRLQSSEFKKTMGASEESVAIYGAIETVSSKIRLNNYVAFLKPLFLLPTRLGKSIESNLIWLAEVFFNNVRPRPYVEINCCPAKASLIFIAKLEYLDDLTTLDLHNEREWIVRIIILA